MFITQINEVSFITIKIIENIHFEIIMYGQSFGILSIVTV